MGFQADCRAAVVTFLTDYAASNGVKLQIYRGRPRTLVPPSGFVDGITEDIDHTTLLTQRNPVVSAIVVFGTYDSGDTVDQKDAFADGLIEWAETRFHQAGANTMIGSARAEDLPEFIPTWLPPEQQKVYYGVRFEFGGFRRGP